MKKIVTIIGARPQFVKAAVVSRAIAQREGIEEVLVHTGQHYDHGMSEVFFEEMDIPHPKYNLGINGVGHGAMTGRMLEGIEEVLQQEKPDVLMVYGDTNSTLAGALAAKKMHIKVAHVEAGLRSFNMAMPEEVNRILTDRISDVLFCPTDTAVHNLRKEGYDHFDAEIINVGDVMYDAAMYYAEKAAQHPDIAAKLGLEKPWILSTIHRQENTDDEARLRRIFKGLDQINETHPVVIPLHPRTKGLLQKYGITTRVNIIDPVSYFEMIQLLKGAALVVTDSGGLQKEAYFFGKYCVTVRDQTEWVELVDHGVNQLAGADTTAIVNAVKQGLEHPMDAEKPLYGDGHAAGKIVECLMR